mgnify:CR=1 FL=1
MAQISGTSSADVLTGTSVSDTFTGGANHDTFVFDGRGGMDTIVDFGASTTTFSVLKDLKVIYTRDFAFGGQQLTEEIMRTYGLSMEDAGRAKKEGGLPSNYQPEVLDAFIDDMTQQVSRSLQFFLASGAGREQPEQILICGGCANIPGVADVVQSRIGIEAEKGDPLGQMDGVVDRPGLAEEDESDGRLAALTRGSPDEHGSVVSVE